MAALVAAVLGPIVPIRAAVRQTQVLVLYSTRRDAQIVTVGERDLPRILEDGIDEGVDYYSEYIDRARFPDPVYRNALYEFLRQKYQGVQFSVVIALNDLALEFVTSNRDQLFTNVPVVFFSTRASPVTVSGASGISSPQDYRGTIALATTLQPDVTQVFVVTGAGSDDVAVEQQARAQFQMFEPRLRFEYLTGLPTKALEMRLRVTSSPLDRLLPARGQGWRRVLLSSPRVSEPRDGRVERPGLLLGRCGDGPRYRRR